MSPLIVSQLSIYPIKSAAEVTLDAMQLNVMGPECDRRWMVIDKNNTFVTQRKDPRICLIRVTLVSDGLRLSVDGLSDCIVSTPASGDLYTSSVWGTEVKGLDCGDDVAQWLSDFLSKDCRLIHMPDNFNRPVAPDFALKQEQVAFADGFPLLITSHASLEDFNNKLGYEVGMNRFRPNIVISGNEAYAEDQWQTIAIGDIKLSLVKPCSRCIMPSINPETAVKEMAVNQALQTHRRRGRSTFFGQNAVYNKLGAIRVGDEVTVLTLKSDDT